MQLLPDRKSPRAERYNYTSAGVYFITICTQDHEEYFGKVVDGDMVLNEIGEVCKQEIQRLNERQTVDIHEWVVMPNHIHLLLCMNERNEAKENTNGGCRDALMGRPNNVKQILRPNIGICSIGNGEGGHSDVSGCGSGVSGCGSDVSGCDLDVSGCGSGVSGCGSDVSGCGSGVSGCGSGVSGCGSGVSGCGSDVSGCGSDVSGCGSDVSGGYSDVPPARPYKGPTLGIIINVFKGNVTKYAQIHNILFARQSRYHDHIVRDEREYNKIKRYIQNNPKKWAEDKMYVRM